MDVSKTQDGLVATLTLTGRLTVTDAAGRLKAAALEAVSGGARAVVLDMSDVPYIDSTRLGELISTHIAVAKQQARLVLVCPTGRISALLRLAGLQGVFETFLSVDEARRALAAPPQG